MKIFNLKQKFHFLLNSCVPRFVRQAIFYVGSVPEFTVFSRSTTTATRTTSETILTPPSTSTTMTTTYSSRKS